MNCNAKVWKMSSRGQINFSVKLLAYAHAADQDLIPSTSFPELHQHSLSTEYRVQRNKYKEYSWHYHTPAKMSTYFPFHELAFFFKYIFLNNDNLNKKQNHSEFNELKKDFEKCMKLQLGISLLFAQNHSKMSWAEDWKNRKAMGGCCNEKKPMLCLEQI